MLRFNLRTNKWKISKKVDAFMTEILDVCKKHNFSIVTDNDKGFVVTKKNRDADEILFDSKVYYNRKPDFSDYWTSRPDWITRTEIFVEDKMKLPKDECFITLTDMPVVAKKRKKK